MAETAQGDRRTRAAETEPSDATTDVAAQIARALSWGIPVASVGTALAVGLAYGLGTAILVLAGGLLLGIIAILWASVRTLSGDAPITLEEAIELGAPSAAEEQKRAVLQALKDLHYERSVGKVSDADYEVLLQRYREEAKRLLRAVDEDLAPLRAKAQAYLEQQLGRPSAATGPAATASGEAKGKRVCPTCMLDNDVDAVFCKKCGTNLDAAKERHDATA
jgi:ribosomal protein L40E